MSDGKICSKCGKRKQVTYFPRDKAKKDGLYPSCKACNRDRIMEYRETHLEQERKRCREYYATLKGYLKNVFHCMNQRCGNPKTHNYYCYGGRGIKINFGSFVEFFDYVTKELQVDPRGLTIDRIDVNGHYEPGNIRFITVAENNQNKRR